ncbi:MAG: hypothetical protein ALECFALPRED_008293 [Alectoria fallacina]|uniref:FAD-binding domain-containing protein n=1 Tax=Alectoria fallacina TaxID=1903189 RepID=A0A8H3I9S5_9LECA|nr:MAG: hypothetical protein ALECFALPRED_008293 [Alectoria fallacina]
MSKPRVLISGASVAGPALAYWLVRAGCKVTVVERAPTLRTAGQGVDVRNTARDVIKRMGIFDRIRDKSSHEEGIEIVDSNGRCFARFGVDEKSGKGDSFTSDVEILRGELAGILFDVTKDDVSYIFGDMVESLEETDKEVGVNFTNGTPTMAFDLVVAADGIGSKIRGIAFGNGSSNVRSLNSNVSYFSIPLGDTDTMWSRARWVKGGRCIVLRPDNVGRTRAFLCLTAYDKSDERLVRLEKASKEGIPAQKLLVQELFHDADWEISRILKGMHESEDFYMQHITQVRLNRWSSGRVTVVGDAGYAPSPFTGMGTSIAFIGAYVLAGEISRQPNNIPAALESYERVLRPYVESIQKLPPGIPWIVNPQSTLGIRVLETVAWGAGVLSATGLATLFSKLAAYVPIGGDSFKLPDYEAFRQ